MKRAKDAMSVICVSASLSSVASAVVVQAGQSVVLNGTSPEASPWMSGTNGPTLFEQLMPVLGASGETVGIVSVRVVRLSTGPFVENGVLLYLIASTSSGASRAESVSLDGFAGLMVDTNWRNDLFPTNVPVPLVTRSVDGDTLTYTLAPGTPSLYAVRPIGVYTHATGFENTGTIEIRMTTGETVTLTGLPAPSPIAACEGDSNGDGVINFVDLNGVLTNFGQPCP